MAGWRAAVLLLSVSVTSSLRLLSPSLLRCSTQGLRCSASQSTCMDRGWAQKHRYTPRGPEQLQASVAYVQDESGHMQPILKAQWTLHDEGSIAHLNATELHVLVLSTNQNLCIRYSFADQLPMQSPSNEKWSFSADMLVLDPGQTYRVSVSNIPKPEMEHTGYDVSRNVTVPSCQDPKVQRTQFCIERGSLWRPNITVTKADAALTVSFRPDSLCEEYMVIVGCSTFKHTEDVYKGGRTMLNATFNLEKWPRSCCQFIVEIKPIFQKCGQDCTRVRRTQDICPDGPGSVSTEPLTPPYTFVALGVLSMCVVMSVAGFFLCRKSDRPHVGAIEKTVETPPPKVQQPPKVLVIYSQDHCLYRNVVLKLCAFLQAKCGAKVLVDLLDSASISMVGPIRWLEWQRQQLKNPSDKILVLCSRGVQAKWRAMCGQGRVLLREDVLSPSDDMLTPFLSLVLPDMHQPGMLGKYMVAYFEDLSSEQDVPSSFDIAVKYRLMKHFEELYFRILDMEKYQPGQVNHIEGVGGEEYFNCPSGRALKEAIETFRLYQLDHPDWFQKECVVSEEEVTTGANLLIDPSLLECVPLIRDGPPVYSQEAEIKKQGNSIYIVAPEVDPESQESSVAQLVPVINSKNAQQDPESLLEVLTDHLNPPSHNSVCVSEPALYKPTPPPGRRGLLLNEEAQMSSEGYADDALLELSQLSARPLMESSAFSYAPVSRAPQSSYISIECFPPSGTFHSQPVETEEEDAVGPGGKGPISGSDQGYISRTSDQPQPPQKEDPLVALERLQEELFQQSFLSLNGGGH